MPQTRSIPDAFNEFERMATRLGLPAPSKETMPNILDGCTAVVALADGRLRLTWDGKEETLVLEISHGPPGGQIFWLDLFCARCPEGVLTEVDNLDVDFQSSLENGMELMGGSI